MLRMNTPVQAFMKSETLHPQAGWSEPLRPPHGHRWSPLDHF